MNPIGLTDRELVEYLDKYSDDPVIRRLISIALDSQSDITDLIEDLEDAGMDPAYQAFDGYQTPGQYIRNLENSVQEYENENNQLKDELEELKTKTVIQFISEVKDQMQSLRSQYHVTAQQLHDTEQQLKKAREHVDMWAAMNRKEAHRA